MYAFDYIRPSSLAEAVRLLAEDADARPLAGGMTLIPTLKQRLASPSRLVDLAGVPELEGIRLGPGWLEIGAMTHHADVAASDTVRSAIPALASLARGIGDPHVRNRGSIGGSVANADPAADYPAAVLSLDASVLTDRREIPADAFFTGLFETALEPGELITAIRFGVPDAAAYAKFPNPVSGYATVGVFVARRDKSVRVAVTGAASSAFRWTALESALSQDFSPAAVNELEPPSTDLNEDAHASAPYRAHLIGVMARRAVEHMMSSIA